MQGSREGGMHPEEMSLPAVILTRIQGLAVAQTPPCHGSCPR